jgi:hypothetical protein
VRGWGVVIVLAACGSAAPARAPLALVAPPAPAVAAPETSPEPTLAPLESREIVATDVVDADDLSQEDAGIRALRAWLDASPGRSIGTSTAADADARWVRWPDRVELCVSSPGGVDAEESCWSIAPAPSMIDVLGRSRRDADDAGSREVLVRLDGLTVAVRGALLVAARVPQRPSVRWADGPPLTFARLEGWSGPVDAVMDLQPSAFDEATVVGAAGVLCHRFGERWACVEPDGLADVEIGRVHRVETGPVDAELWVEGESCDGGSEEWDCSHAVHVYVREGARLIERGSIAVASDREVRTSGTAGEGIAWSWSVAGPDCLVIGDAHAERHQSDERQVSRARPDVAYGATVDRIARFAGASDPAGLAVRLSDLDADMQGGPPRPAPIVEDRRGTFRLVDEWWMRTESCAP